MKKYKGKNAWWVLVVFVIYNALPMYYRVDINMLNGIILFFYYLANLIFIPILFRNYIELYDDYFTFYYGFSKEIIQIKDIIKIEKKKSFIASSANSIDRIYIKTKKKDLYVALKNNDDFINEMKMRDNKFS